MQEKLLRYMIDSEVIDPEDQVIYRYGMQLDLLKDKNGRLYFEYGVMFERVYLDEFEEAA